MIFARVQVAVKAREIAAGDFQPQPVTCQEDVACRAHFDSKLVSLTRIHHLRMFLRTTVAAAQDAVVEVTGKSVRRYINQFRCEIRIHG